MTMLSNRTLRFIAIFVSSSFVLVIFDWQPSKTRPSSVRGRLFTEPQVLRSDSRSDEKARQLRVACQGFREALINAENTVDVPMCRKSFHIEWMTLSQRYGPFGYSKASNAKSEVDWDAVDWGQLQNECAEKNKDRFSPRESFSPG
ncbi:hypothetical protein CERZMDRAFT_101452 [Cercospora zeae-maydis SCOH1-5]|uniref:Uncharacterized protein n=1 Tax=Cercospora zeae-maydis SCOH1-5 TaxID=717836 RepID=A0A6A6F513_9PEZI|nr:hypothetical protein CERZMDRAFT_101452 [Cercospora zeae-maydis SCOH1-5]